MCLLPQALHHCGQFTQKQVRTQYLIARRMAENHFGIMAVELGLNASVYAYVPQPLSARTVVDGNGGNGSTREPAAASVVNGVVATLVAGSGIHDAYAAYSFPLAGLRVGQGFFSSVWTIGDFWGKSEDILLMMNRMAKEFKAD